MNTPQEIPFRLRNIELIEFCIHEEGKNATDIPEDHFGKKFSFLVRLEMRADYINNAVAIRPTIIVEGPEITIHYATITTQLVFEFEGLSKYLNEKEMNLPKHYIDRMNSIAISTTRGVLWKELESTPLRGAVLPVVDVSLFEMEDIEHSSTEIK